MGLAQGHARVDSRTRATLTPSRACSFGRVETRVPPGHALRCTHQTFLESRARRTGSGTRAAPGSRCSAGPGSPWGEGGVSLRGQVSWVLNPLLGLAPGTEQSRGASGMGGLVPGPGTGTREHSGDSQGKAVSPWHRLKVRGAGPENRLPAHPRSVLCGRLCGQALFSGLKIKASWPGPCWQRGGGAAMPQA